MKKLFCSMALMLGIASFGLMSCDKDDDNGNGNDTKVTLKMPDYKADAVKLTLTPVSIPGKHMLLQEIELSESGSYFLTYIDESSPANTRAGGHLKYKRGKFKKTSDGYELEDFGTIFLKSDVVLVITPTGGNAIEVSCVKGSKKSSNDMTDYLCRTWTITKTQLRLQVDGATVGREFNGACNMNEIIAYARECGAKINDVLEPNTVINGITFTDSGSFIIDYRNGKIDMGTWSWSNLSNGDLSYKWNSGDMGYSVEIGMAAVAFSGNTCKFGLKGKVNGEDLELLFTLQ